MVDVRVETVEPPAKPAPLFTLDLSANGDVLAPATHLELSSWIRKEEAFWAWIQPGPASELHNFLSKLHEPLRQASEAATLADRQRPSSSDQSAHHLERCREFLRRAFVEQQLPHSTTPVAKRIEALRKEAGPKAAAYYMWSYCPPSVAGPIGNMSADAWRGLIEGVVDRTDLLRASTKRTVRSAMESLDELRAKTESLYAEKQATYDQLHRAFLALSELTRAQHTQQVQSFAETSAKQASDFQEAEAARADRFRSQADAHSAELERLRKVFREEMAMRAPVDYWGRKAHEHRNWAICWGTVAAVMFVMTTIVLGMQVSDVLAAMPPDKPPQLWRLATLALIGVFLVWALRIVVRLFLSSMHLATDAGERVVMVETYLSLVEGEQARVAEDRLIILQALFRPGADGIVKDEALPFTPAEVLSRLPKPQ